MSWANIIQATTPFEAEEIGISPLVADAWGLREGMTVSCSVIQNTSPLKSVSITLNGDDYQMAECSTEKIQSELLDQIAVVARFQSIVIWLSKSISVKAVVGELTKISRRIRSDMYVKECDKRALRFPRRNLKVIVKRFLAHFSLSCAACPIIIR